MLANGDIYLGTYAGWYAMRDEAFYAENEIKIGADGKKYSPFDSEVTWVEEKSYFFRLSAFQDRLLKLYADHPDFIAPDSRRNEVISFVKQGLRDLLFLLGGPRIDHKLARELGYDAGFGPGTRPSQVASYVLQELLARKGISTTDAIAKLAEKH